MLQSIGNRVVAISGGLTTPEGIRVVTPSVQQQTLAATEAESNPEPLLTARQVADMIGVAPDTVLDWWEADKIPGFRIAGRAVRFRWSELEASFEKRGAKTRPTAVL